ncbi:MAG: hypothetical protein OEX16_01940 [Hadesarchaea archaeon]|nr:hypothetical protein [Hadesarchaea archaeon]
MKEINSTALQERYELGGQAHTRKKLRRYFYQTGKAYISVAKKFLKSGKEV